MGYAVSNDVLNPTEPVSYDTRLRNRSKMTRSVARPPRQELDLAYVDLHRPRVGGKTIGSNRGYEAKFLSHACQATAEFVHLLDEGFVILAAEMVC